MGQLIDEKINMIYPKKENGEYPVLIQKELKKTECKKRTDNRLLLHDW